MCQINRRVSWKFSVVPVLAVLFFSCMLIDAEAQVKDPAYKDPGRARLYSVFIPGSGHFYAGERGKGAFLLVGSSLALVVGVLQSDFESDFDFTCQSFNCTDPDAYDPNYTPLIVGTGIAGALWLYGLYDAPKAARRANQKRGLASLSIAPVPMMYNGGLKPGLSMRLKF